MSENITVGSATVVYCRESQAWIGPPYLWESAVRTRPVGITLGVTVHEARGDETVDGAFKRNFEKHNRRLIYSREEAIKLAEKINECMLCQDRKEK